MFEFVWTVHEGGYQWVQARVQWVEQENGHERVRVRKQWLLAEKSAANSASGSRRYRPLESHADLFQIFAETMPSKRGIQGFADQHGFLGGELQGTIEVDGELVPAEPLSSWRREIRAMHLATTLWELARKKKRKEISRLVRYVPERGIWIGQKDSQGGLQMTIANKDLHPELLWTKSGEVRFKAGQEDRIALSAVQAIINKNTRRHAASLRVLWAQNFTCLQLHSVPGSLSAALWCQFAQAVAGNARFRECEQCGKHFEVSLNASRADARFCGGPCKQRRYRRRKRARELNAQGWKLKDIAARLGTEPRAVKRLLLDT